MNFLFGFLCGALCCAGVILLSLWVVTDSNFTENQGGTTMSQDFEEIERQWSELFKYEGRALIDGEDEEIEL